MQPVWIEVPAVPSGPAGTSWGATSCLCSTSSSTPASGRHSNSRS